MSRASSPILSEPATPFAPIRVARPAQSAGIIADASRKFAGNLTDTLQQIASVTVEAERNTASLENQQKFSMAFDSAYTEALGKDTPQIMPTFNASYQKILGEVQKIPDEAVRAKAHGYVTGRYTASHTALTKYHRQSLGAEYVGKLVLAEQRLAASIRRGDPTVAITTETSALLALYEGGVNIAYTQSHAAERAARLRETVRSGLIDNKNTALNNALYDISINPDDMGPTLALGEMLGELVADGHIPKDEMDRSLLALETNRVASKVRKHVHANEPEAARQILDAATLPAGVALSLGELIEQRRRSLVTAKSAQQRATMNKINAAAIGFSSERPTFHQVNAAARFVVPGTDPAGIVSDANQIRGVPPEHVAHLLSQASAFENNLRALLAMAGGDKELEATTRASFTEDVQRYTDAYMRDMDIAGASAQITPDVLVQLDQAGLIGEEHQDRYVRMYRKAAAKQDQEDADFAKMMYDITHGLPVSTEHKPAFDTLFQTQVNAIQNPGGEEAMPLRTAIVAVQKKYPGTLGKMTRDFIISHVASGDPNRMEQAAFVFAAVIADSGRLQEQIERDLTDFEAETLLQYVKSRKPGQTPTQETEQFFARLKLEQRDNTTVANLLRSGEPHIASTYATWQEDNGLSHVRHSGRWPWERTSSKPDKLVDGVPIEEGSDPEGFFRFNVETGLRSGLSLRDATDSALKTMNRRHAISRVGRPKMMDMGPAAFNPEQTEERRQYELAVELLNFIVNDRSISLFYPQGTNVTKEGKFVGMSYKSLSDEVRLVTAPWMAKDEESERRAAFLAPALLPLWSSPTGRKIVGVVSGAGEGAGELRPVQERWIREKQLDIIIAWMEMTLDHTNSGKLNRVRRVINEETGEPESVGSGQFWHYLWQIRYDDEGVPTKMPIMQRAVNAKTGETEMTQLRHDFAYIISQDKKDADKARAAATTTAARKAKERELHGVSTMGPLGRVGVDMSGQMGNKLPWNMSIPATPATANSANTGDVDRR